MKAVVFDGPRSVSIQDRPVPQIQDDEDIIVKVSATALCGSELHVYRGHQPSTTGFIMGHEFTGTVRRLPHHETSAAISKAPPSISDEALILMADIFPTGFFGVKSALSLAPPTLNIQESTLVVIGCGPVGLCAIVAAAEQKPKHLFAIDGVDSRLEQARQLGAEPLNFLSDKAGMMARILEATGGRGADLVVEVVGLSPALRTAFDIVRPFGVISSIGVHNAEIPWSGSEAYGKNIRLQMGRCPVRSIFSEALVLLEKKQHLLGFMFENIMPLNEAVQGYTLFDEMKVQKVVFKP
ncbi:zinc-binding dehydrogenase domain-containing protein [Trichoderma breve]|uniref:Zinc-binding dehydrogenase domain-containing protein n=1 Tax=Trichoderma breve TaxID=2034170 RepID=A0A9W9B346_9HYPO|nr:zinc-binding dehydrogenase domain-containing protein [Trichoderma breve]KAJ4854492.1 zinc-binding dehydrogenase domain-containing protein [Trichoderma breve]